MGSAKYMDGSLDVIGSKLSMSDEGVSMIIKVSTQLLPANYKL